MNKPYLIIRLLILNVKIFYRSVKQYKTKQQQYYTLLILPVKNIDRKVKKKIVYTSDRAFILTPLS